MICEYLVKSVRLGIGGTTFLSSVNAAEIDVNPGSESKCQRQPYLARKMHSRDSEAVDWPSEDDGSVSTAFNESGKKTE